MRAVFLEIVNMSVTAGGLILAVILIRFVFRKMPKWIVCALWGVTAIRLICPFSIESAMSLVPASKPVDTTMYIGRPYIQSGVDLVDNTVNAYLGSHYYEGVTVPAKESAANPINILAVIWLTGMLLMAAYAVVSYIRLKRSVRASISVSQNVLECDDISFPFILGMIRPMIYLPSSMDESAREFVMTHERAHIKRLDHWWKPVGFLVLAIHWFNPLCWISYILLCRDIELATDEKVIKEMTRDDIAGYSQTLLNMGHTRRLITACPVAFGEVGVKERVKSILNYRKPAFWVLVASVLACIVISVCFLTNPKDKADEPDVAEPEKIYTKDDVINDYICEQIGFGGMFTLTVSEDGTFYYYEGLLSSYFGTGKWQFEDNKLTLLDEGTGKIRKAVFRYEDGDLLYCQQESDEYPFTYVELTDGTGFIPKDEADEAFYEELDRQQKEQAEELARRVREVKSGTIEKVIVKEFVGENVEGFVFVDATKIVKNKQMPIKIWIENTGGRILWESELRIPENEWTSFYLYEEDSINYVIQYNPKENEEQIAYTFKMFTLNEKGEESVKCEFSANSEEERKIFNSNVESYLHNARLLVNILRDTICIEDGNSPIWRDLK